MINKPRHRNQLWIARKQAGMGQKSVARLLGYRSVSPISEYETGRLLPSLPTAFRLEALYNVPIEELYASLFRQVQEEIELRKRKYNVAPSETVQLNDSIWTPPTNQFE